MGESLQQERESPWELTLTKRVPEAFEIPPSDWPEKYFSGQSAKRNSRATLMSSYTRLFSSSNAVAQGAEESCLTVMLAQFIAQIDLVIQNNERD